MNVTFEPYHTALLPDVIAVFRSNMPVYFFDYEEVQLRDQLAQRQFDYYVMRLNGEPIGAGGQALNADDTVSLCWGMVHANYHKLHYGEALLKFRLEKIHEKWPGKPIVNVTSQHTTGFFEKYGFKVLSVKENGFGPGLHACKMELQP